jgi:hypothetical protein
MRRATMVRLLTLLGLCTLGLSPLSAQSSGVTVRQVRPTGAIAGVVRDVNGQPLADVRILIESLTWQARTSDAGGFIIEGLPPGTHLVRFRKVGYQEAFADIPVIADSGVTVNVTMAPIAEQLDAVVIEGTILNQVTGLVTDESGTPMAGVVVEILGMNFRLETNEQGRYVLLDLKPGNYLLQFRAPGYRVSQYGLRMVAQIERDITTKLQRARAGDRMSAAVAASVALEAHRRQSLRGTQSILMGRDELERYDTAPLGDALLNSRAGLLLREVNTSCILINGHEPLSGSTAAEQLESLTRLQGAGGFGTRAGGAQGAVAGPTGSARVQGGWLNFFRANEVELLEIYTEGSENSRTVCGRFPPSSGCTCPPLPSAIVIWLRR